MSASLISTEQRYQYSSMTWPAVHFCSKHCPLYSHPPRVVASNANRFRRRPISTLLCQSTKTWMRSHFVMIEWRSAPQRSFLRVFLCVKLKPDTRASHPSTQACLRRSNNLLQLRFCCGRKCSGYLQILFDIHAVYFRNIETINRC